MSILSDYLIAGVDEAGRGPLAGPLVVAAVILDAQRPVVGIKDSKKLSESARNTLASKIRGTALAFHIEVISRAEIDQHNILQATLRGMARALHALNVRPHLALIDGNQLPERLPCAARAIIGGDASEPAIGAASILAKVERDRLMIAMENLYPGYGFAQHKGYPTPGHFAALDQLGPCPEHRHSFAPVKLALKQRLW